MPVRLLNSSVLTWPNQACVDSEVRSWAFAEGAKHPKLRGLAYFGSYARGDWGVGSDLDLVAIVEDSLEPFHRRSLNWDLSALPVPTDLLVYTLDEWHRLISEDSLFAQTLRRELIWIYPLAPSAERL